MLALLPAVALWGQLDTGVLRVVVEDERGQPVAGVVFTVHGTPAAYIVQARSGAGGVAEFVLPYGPYRLSSSETGIYISPLQTACAKVVIDDARAVGQASKTPCYSLTAHEDHPWAAKLAEEKSAVSDSLQGLLLDLEPTTVTEPLDFSGLSSMRLALLSQSAFSWTDVRYTLQGMDASDSYQPGRTLLLPDVSSVSDVVVRSGADPAAVPAYGSEVGSYLRVPLSSWHGDVSSGNTASFLASYNLPGPAARGSLEQSERFIWFTRDNIQAGGPVGHRADLVFSGTGQWASQTVLQAPPGAALNSRLLFGYAKGRAQVTSKDQLEGQYCGSRINLSNWGVPAGLEALFGRRMSPSFTVPAGFPGSEETDHLDFLQAGWTRQVGAGDRVGALQVRYAFSTAHLDTSTPSQPGAQSRIDLVGGIVDGPPPLGNLAVRTRQSVGAAFEPGELSIGGHRHHLVIGGDWERAKIRNRLDAPSDLNLVTANGTPAFIVALNTPIDNRELTQSASTYIQDKIRLAPGLAADLALASDFSRGSLPPQSSPAGSYAPTRRFAAQRDLISWNSVSPRLGFALAPPKLRTLVLRGSYARLYGPLAGRYLDFRNANSLGGSQYQWLDKNGDGIYQPSEIGPLLMVFGGPYSSIDRKLKRPYADEFHLGAELSLPGQTVAAIRLFRRDEKNRIAAINTGVTAQDYNPVQILDPGRDGLRGTFDDQRLTVYAQDPFTFGKDRYLLTNPSDLRMLNTGFVAEIGGGWRQLRAHASFMVVKSYGLTNPGNSALENDPGVIGALFLDPGTAIRAAGRTYFDRAYVGKVQLLAKLPTMLGGIELANTAIYMDGLVFGRRLLVSGLPQGPLLVDTTVRGSPGGGNRAEYVLNWNVRLSRSLPVRYGSLRLALNLFNVTNENNSLRQSDISGPLFNQRLPIVIAPPRFFRFNIQYHF